MASHRDILSGGAHIRVQATGWHWAVMVGMGQSVMGGW